MKRLRHLTRRASGPVRGVAAREALCGKSVEPFASLEPGCPVRCTPALDVPESFWVKAQSQRGLEPVLGMAIWL